MAWVSTQHMSMGKGKAEALSGQFVSMHVLKEMLVAWISSQYMGIGNKSAADALTGQRGHVCECLVSPGHQACTDMLILA